MKPVQGSECSGMSKRPIKEDKSSERETWGFVGLGKDSEATERMREGSHNSVSKWGNMNREKGSC